MFYCRRSGYPREWFLLMVLLFGPATTGDDTIVSSRVGWKGVGQKGEKEEEENESRVNDMYVMGLDESIEVEGGWLLF